MAQGVFLSVGSGIGKVSVEESFRLDSRATNDDNWVMEFSAGHAFASNVLMEGSGVRGVSINILGGDSYEFKDERLMVGYSFSVAPRFSVVPQLGISFWDMRAADGSFLSAPKRTGDFDGEDAAWRIRGEYALSDLLRLYFSYTKTQHDFGEFSLPSVGVRFQF